jgi:hypothetical protein
VVVKSDPRLTFAALPAGCRGSAALFECTRASLAPYATATWQLVATALPGEPATAIVAASSYSSPFNLAAVAGVAVSIQGYANGDVPMPSVAMVLLAGLLLSVLLRR